LTKAEETLSIETFPQTLPQIGFKRPQAILKALKNNEPKPEYIAGMPAAKKQKRHIVSKVRFC